MVINFMAILWPYSRSFSFRYWYFFLKPEFLAFEKKWIKTLFFSRFVAFFKFFLLFFESFDKQREKIFFEKARVFFWHAMKKKMKK